MSSLLFLTTDDFSIANGENGPLLHHDISGFSLVLFYSTQCVYCQNIIPIFKRLPDLINGCQFGMVNVSMNNSLVRMSANSITPIKYVPLLILYINGRPYVRYEGPHKEEDIRRFILEVSNSVQETGFSKVTKERGIPSYTVGHPLYGEKEVCYLDFDDAYVN
jgi:thiol-disulfide isomerase/thioredoxin